MITLFADSEMLYTMCERREVLTDTQRFLLASNFVATAGWLDGPYAPDEFNIR